LVSFYGPRAKRRSSSVCTYYEDYEATRAYQAGGVSQWAVNKMVHQICESGQDGTGLGRWTWQVFGVKKACPVAVMLPISLKYPRVIEFQLVCPDVGWVR
jgi:hypothetical protein